MSHGEDFFFGSDFRTSFISEGFSVFRCFFGVDFCFSSFCHHSEDSASSIEFLSQSGSSVSGDGVGIIGVSENITSWSREDSEDFSSTGVLGLSHSGMKS